MSLNSNSAIEITRLWEFKDLQEAAYMSEVGERQVTGVLTESSAKVTANSRMKVVINLPRTESSFEDFTQGRSRDIKPHVGGRGSFLHMALNKEEHALDEDGAKGDAAPPTLKKPRRKVSFLDVDPMKGDEPPGTIVPGCDQVNKANKVLQLAKPQTRHLPDGPLRNVPPNLAGCDKPTDPNQPLNVQRLQLGSRYKGNEREANGNLNAVPLSKPVRVGSQASWQWDLHQPRNPFMRKIPNVTVKWVSASCYPRQPLLIPQQLASPLYPRYTMGQQIHAYFPRAPLMYDLVPVEQLPLQPPVTHTMGQRLPRIWNRTGAPLRPCAYPMDRAASIMSCPGYMNTGLSSEDRPDMETSTTFL